MSTLENHLTFSKAQEETVLDQLRQVLESTFFRGSDRCCRFLEYSVQHVVQGRPSEEMKERNIGVDVFHRAPAYDTAQDNIVRVTANEVRKRLAQYYGSAGDQESPVIALPQGTYAVTFRWTPANPSSVAKTAVNRELPLPTEGAENKRTGLVSYRQRGIAAAVVIVGLAITFVVYQRSKVHDVTRDVWAPMLESPKTVLVCISQPPAFGQRSSTNFFPMPDAFVGVGDAYALADISRLLSARGKTWRLLAGNETPSQDLKSGPVILIGVFANPWTLRLTENLRFVFSPAPDVTVVSDRSQPGKQWRLTNLMPDGRTPEDYAIVSRFVSPETGEPVIVLAGLSNYGTQAAGEFFTDPEMLEAALRQAPKDWRNRNFQFVLHTRILGKTPERPTVVAAHFW